MPERPTALTAAAGEHFVAYRLSQMGFPVALTRGGTPNIDLMVADPTGKTAVSIQVKTSSWARRFRKKDSWSYREWDVGRRGLSLEGDSILYAFVDLSSGDEGASPPAVFIVPSAKVAGFMKPDWSRFMFWIDEKDNAQYLERWDLVKAKLGGQPTVGDQWP